jgi:hypothetical protein
MQRYVILRNQVFQWEEKEPFTKSGKSILGALEYDREKDAVKCHECGEWFHYIGGSHLMRKHSMTARQYRQCHSLRVRTGLCSPAYFNQHSDHMRRLYESGRLCSGPGPSHQHLHKSRGHRGPHSYGETRNEQNACKAQTLACIQQIAADPLTEHQPCSDGSCSIPAQYDASAHGQKGAPPLVLNQIGRGSTATGIQMLYCASC